MFTTGTENVSDLYIRILSGAGETHDSRVRKEKKNVCHTCKIEPATSAGLCIELLIDKPTTEIHFITVSRECLNCVVNWQF